MSSVDPKKIVDVVTNYVEIRKKAIEAKKSLNELATMLSKHNVNELHVLALDTAILTCEVYEIQFDAIFCQKAVLDLQK